MVGKLAFLDDPIYFQDETKECDLYGDGFSQLNKRMKNMEISGMNYHFDFCIMNYEFNCCTYEKTTLNITKRHRKLLDSE